MLFSHIVVLRIQCFPVICLDASHTSSIFVMFLITGALISSFHRRGTFKDFVVVCSLSQNRPLFESKLFETKKFVFQERNIFSRFFSISLVRERVGKIEICNVFSFPKCFYEVFLMSSNYSEAPNNRFLPTSSSLNPLHFEIPVSTRS